MGKSTSKEPGGVSPQLSDAGKEIAKEPEKSLPDRLPGANDLSNTENGNFESNPNIEKEKDMTGTESASETGTPETETSIALRSEQESSAEIQHGVYSHHQNSLKEARFQSMNLIDESSQLLVGLLRSQTRKMEKFDERLADFRQLNAVANIGKQISSLAKVKLDAIKEARTKR